MKPLDIIKGPRAVELLETLVERYRAADCPFCGSAPMTTHRDRDCLMVEAEKLVSPALHSR